jgi:hypothetical protein
MTVLLELLNASMTCLVFSKHVVQLKNNEEVALSAQTGFNVFS